MSQVEALLSAAGIDPRQERAAAAALMVRRFPMRIGGISAGSPKQTLDRGWCAGPTGLADLLATVTGVEAKQGEAFGADWPWLELQGFVVAPGLPVRLFQGCEEAGPDGVYELDGSGVFREAAGCRRRVLTTQAPISRNAPDFELLWFSDNARFIVRKAALEVEDLFSKTTCWVDEELIERLLVRTRRVDAGVFDGLKLARTEQPVTVEVSRMFDVEKIPWWDPLDYLQNRIDFSRTESRGGTVIFEDIRGETTEFQASSVDSGWSIERVAGRFPFESLSFNKRRGTGTLKATLAAEADIFSPGIRGRVVFDLNADLSALIRRHQKV